MEGHVFVGLVAPLAEHGVAGRLQVAGARLVGLQLLDEPGPREDGADEEVELRRPVCHRCKIDRDGFDENMESEGREKWPALTPRR